MQTLGWPVAERGNKRLFAPPPRPLEIGVERHPGKGELLLRPRAKATLSDRPGRRKVEHQNQPGRKHICRRVLC
jgi:hypothetical protein